MLIKINNVILIFLISMLIPSTASATLVKALEFNVDGILPSDEADISYLSSSGYVPSGLYSVTNGFLKQRTIGIDGIDMFVFPNTGSSIKAFDASLNTTLEFRVKVLDVSAIAPFSGGISISIFDDVNRYSTSLTSSGIDFVILDGSGGFTIDHYDLDVFDFHTYRIESPGNSNEVRLFVDDLFALSTIANISNTQTTGNGFNFGDTISAASNGDADWDYIRISQGEQLTAVPVPVPFILFLSSLFSLFLIRNCSLRLKTVPPCTILNTPVTNAQSIAY